MKEITPEDVAKVRVLAHGLNAPTYIDKEDLVQHGCIAMIRAARRFDPAKSVYFFTYATKMIVGAMKDYLRRLDPLSQRERRKVYAGVAEDVEVVPLSGAADGEDEAISVASPDPSPLERMLHAEAARHTRAMVAALPNQERRVIEQYFGNGRSLRSIGRTMGVHESSVKRLRDSALRHMREAMAA